MQRISCQTYWSTFFFFAAQRTMERANHINIAMIDNIDTNGSAGSKVTAAAVADRSDQPLGSTVSFHNIHYKVQLRSGIFGKKKSSGKEILTDLKLAKQFPDCWYNVGFFSSFLHFLMVLNTSSHTNFPWKKRLLISHSFLCLLLPRG